MCILTLTWLSPQDDRVKVFGDCWDCVYDGELKLQAVGSSHKHNNDCRTRVSWVIYKLYPEYLIVHQGLSMI